MVTTYALASEVAGLIRTDAFTACTTPTLKQVEDIINRSEDRIDQRTGHTYGREKVIAKEYHCLPLVYTFGWGTPVYLGHRDIQTSAAPCELKFDACKGDKLELWNGFGCSFSDITATSSDYEIIGERGELYTRNTLFTILRDNRIRVTYRYGSTDVPNDIRDACIKMVAIDLITGSFRMDIIPMGADGAKVFDATAKWREDIDRIIRNREEVFVLP